ncbi:MAG: hypothetical protein KA104_01450 [Candidatus Pacebacteria bacterium]|nr:hypothetical protein [Candidatus Paceibacterota bacterium]
MNSEHPETIFKYRLIETTYRQRVEWEDGPGSLRNIVSDVSERIVAIWVGYKNIARFIYPNQPDGWEDYSYHIERKAKGAYAWEYDRWIDKSTEGRQAQRDKPDSLLTLDEYLASELPETEWEEPEYRCCTCNELIAPDVHECAACEAAEVEKYRPRCCACHEPCGEWQVICDDCDRKFGLERLVSVLEFRVLDTYWWRELLDYLRMDVMGSFLKRVRR